MRSEQEQLLKSQGGEASRLACFLLICFVERMVTVLWACYITFYVVR